MTDSDGPVVVGVDGSYTAIRAARWAAAVARRLEASLHIVHAEPYVGHNFSDAIAEIRAIEMTSQHELAQAILKAAEHAVRADCADLLITTEDLSESADTGLIELSHRARMIVLGSEEVTLGTAILVGSTTVAVATRASCPVIVWRGDSVAPTSQPILLGVDGDDDSRVAITAAFELADRLGVDIVAVHAWSKRRSPGDVNLPFMIDWDAMEADQRQHLSDKLSRWIRLYPDVGVTFVADAKRPSKALLSRSANAQLVVVGSRGRGPMLSVVLGSTGMNLLHHSAVPVMICRSATQTQHEKEFTHRARTGTTP